MNNKTKKIKKVAFINDLGNIKTTNEVKIKKGKLYRASALTNLNKKSICQIESRLALNTIIDFRSNSEVNYKNDVMIPNTKYYHVTPLNDDDNPVVNKKSRMRILKDLYKKEGGTKKHLMDIYRKLVSSNLATESYSKMLRELIDNPSDSYLWHCTQGKDRTGMFSAIILLALGVDTEDIIKDYIHYNKHCALKNGLIFIAMTIFTLNIKMAKGLHNLLVAKRVYIEAAFDEMNKVYGNTHNFLEKAMRLSNDDIIKLRKVYVINND